MSDQLHSQNQVRHIRLYPLYLLVILPLFLFLSGIAGAQEETIRILKLEPTALFPRREPLRQIADLHLYNSFGYTIVCQVTLQLDHAEPLTSEIEAPAGSSTHRLLVSDISSPQGLQLVLRNKSNDAVIAQHRQMWQPQRHWKVHIIKSSHEDLGYEDYIHKKQHDIAEFIDLARTLSGPRENVAEIERSLGLSSYHYTMESLLFMRNYIEERSESQWREIADKDIKTGRMHLMGAPSGVHTHWMDYEELARMTYGARREAKDRFGLDLKTFMMVDNPSASWSACQALANAGFKYLARWGQGWRTGGNNDYKTTRLPALFWWRAPDRQSKLLFGWRSHYGLSFWYGQTGGGYGNLIDVASRQVTQELQAIERGERLGPYPYDALINPEYIDHDTPRFDTRVLPVWNKTYRYPEIRIGNPTEFFEYIENKYGNSLPELSGDLNNFSADYATIDPESQGWKRRAARLLPLAEGLAAIAGLNEPGFLPPARLIDRTFVRLFDYNEHSWPTLPKASDVQLFNAQWLKKNEAARALQGAEQALQIGFEALLRQIPVQEAQTVVVFNPLAHERTDLAEVQWTPALFGSLGDPGPDGMQLVDTTTGQDIPSQQTTPGRLLFIARNVPAFGYKLYRLRPSNTTPALSSLQVGSASLSNQFYTVEFDPKTGVVRSILDKELGRQLVDSKAAHGFNQLVYAHKNAREARDGFVHSPQKARLMPGKAGPIRAELTVEIDDEKTGAAIRQQVILYDQLKRIDVINELKHVQALYSSNYEDRYKDNLYYAFPVKVDDFETHVEYPGGVVRPHTDQLRWGSHDYLYANRWVDVSNQSYGVTMAPWEAGTVNFGEIRYNQFSIDYKPVLPHLFSYVYSNRMAGLLTLNGWDCNATLHYSFTSHPGDWRNGATRFGWQIASPLQARLISSVQKGLLPERQASFATLSASNVQMATLKQSEQPGRGWVLRLVETEGRQTEVEVQLPHFPVTAAMACDLVENDLNLLKVEQRKVRVLIAPHGFVTVRLFAAEPLSPAVTQLKAEPISDSSIRLEWAGAVPAGGAFNVFRSEDPGAPPTAYTLVGRAVGNRFVDRELRIDTAYSYFVAPVSRFNNQGTFSEKVMAHTKKENTSPPAAVEELGIVRRAADRLIVYWRSSPEPDVARYLLFRSETKDFEKVTPNPLRTLKPAPYFLQTFHDRGLQPGKTYHYKVLAEDWAGNRQTQSPIASAQTPVDVR
ncbi:MAG: glycosyl hydrolase-related protein [Acidobacteria bacterium]|nr:glycosyl hydrolase-related protein [Acidobacteriota bacterium]MCI0723296.1 glycosyl hydrolase-related protein [Acidobacteriota bacterium]